MGMIYIILGILVSGVHLTDGRIYYQDVKVQHSPAEAHFDPLMDRSFGFLSGGELHFSLQCPFRPPFEPPPRPDFWVLLCSASDAREFSRMTFQQLNFDCQRLSQYDQDKMSRADAYCTRMKVWRNLSMTEHQFVYVQKMDYSNFITLILLQCPDLSLPNTTVYSNIHDDCKSTVLALNPGAVQLSSDEIPLPFIYTVVNLTWGVLVAAWFFNWVIYFRYSNRLHRLISWAPIFKVILVVLILLWWQEIANTGLESSDISSVYHFVQSLEDSLVFVTMMIIAEGWGVVRTHIKHYRWTSLLLLFALFATSLMCVYWVHRYFLAFSVCCVVFMMYKTLKWSSHNIELLRRRRRKMRRFISRHSLHYTSAATIDQQLASKLAIYNKFRVITVMFSMTYAVAVTLATFLNEYTYVRALTFEVPELLFYVAIGFIFRLRNFEAFEHIELVPPRENVVILELPDVCVSMVTPHVVLGLPLHFKVEKETQTPVRRWRRNLR